MRDGSEKKNMEEEDGGEVMTLHLCQSVSGALRNWTKDIWDSVGAQNNMTGNQMKEKFRIMEFEGKKVIPFGKACDGFSYETGCPGHEKQEKTPQGVIADISDPVDSRSDGR